MVSSTPRPYFTPGKGAVPTVQEAGCAPGPVWMGGKFRPTGIRTPDRPVRITVGLYCYFQWTSSNAFKCVRKLLHSFALITSHIKNAVFSDVATCILHH